MPAPLASGPYRAGDDAVWLKSPGALTISVDTIAEGVHFQRRWCSPQDLGWRSLQAALSDLAACRAQPVGFLLAVSVPANDFQDCSWLDGVIAGIGEAARHWDCPVLGGDTTSSPAGLVLSLTVIGQPLGAPLCRAGAQPGQLLQLSGRCGWAALAVESLLSAEAEPPEQLAARALQAWRRPCARLDLLNSLQTATAAIDISDGLLADAEHLSKASSCALLLDRQALLDPELIAVAGESRAANLTLTGGEDYELLICTSEPLEGFFTVGEVQEGKGVRWLSGERIEAQGIGGWVHGVSG